MPAIDFPNSPSTNDAFVSGGKRWVYNGSAWILSTPATYVIANNEVTEAKIASDSITTTKIATNAVTTAKILDANVTAGKIASGAAVTNIGYTPANIAGPTFTGTVVLPSTTSIGTVSATEIGYVDGVTSAIQTQLDSKLTATTAITSNRNAIINGSFSVWQRSTDATTVGSYGYATADRWISRTATGPGSVRVSRQAASDLTGFRYCARVQRTASNTDTGALQIIHTLETANSIPFAGKTVTLSFYARKGADYSYSGSGMNYQLHSGTGTDQHWTSFTGSSTVISQTTTISGTWQRFSYSATVSSTATQLYMIFQMVPVGTAGANDYFEITGVQLEAGSVATPFEFEDYGTTFAKCQRYFETQDWTINTWRTAVVYSASQNANGYFTYEPKRVTPSFSWSANGSARYISNAGINSSQTLSAQYGSYNGSSFNTSGTFAVSAGWVDSAGTLSISAEL